MAAPIPASHATSNGHSLSPNGNNGVNAANGTNGDVPRNWSASPEPGSAGLSDSEPALDGFGFHRHESHPIRPPGLHDGDAGGPRSRAHAKIRTYTDDSRRRQFPRISKPVELLRSSYDCIVIGSGYGGGVAASRMARAGESVCVLERGKERWPGEYPNGPKEAFDQLHYSGNFAPGFLDGSLVEGGDPTGMYHLIFGKGQNAVVCNGLGGTSLMNANVFLEADEDTLAMKMWPSDIRDHKGALDEYYEKARKVLQPKRYPEDWPKLPKMELLKKQAEYLGMADKFHRVEQTTRFRNGPNSCGVEMSPSALTGQDCTGVNDGSKNTTLVTYLADAWNWGAEMFCECEVRYIEKVKDERGGYLVYFAWHGRNRGHFKANLHGDLMWVHAKKAVFLGAGTIGTTEILLRSKAMGLSMSDNVGQNMSGNGDILAFGYNTDYEVNSIGRPFPSPYNPVGPCITGIIDNRRGHENPLDGFVIEEGAVPQALAPFLQTMLDLMPGSSSSEETISDRAHAALARWGSRLLGPYFKKGAIERTQIYLIMSHDSNQAMLTLKDDKPVLEFLGVGRSDHVKYLNNLLIKATQAVGGTFVQTPFFALMGQQQVTVHPIGGACMARDGTGETGVTNHLGEVFSGPGKETHDGLIVTDAAIIPGALGANPFATITALAERSVAEYCKKKQLTISEEENGILDLFGEPEHPPQRRHATREERAYQAAEAQAEIESVDEAKDVILKAEAINASGFGFTEVMSGFVHYDENMKDDKRETYELAARTAKNLCESARFFLSVQAFNTKVIVNDPEHRGMLTGTFVCPTIPGSPFMVQRGEFNLFIMDHKAPGTKNLTYDFDMKGTNGKLLHFHGYKVVDSSVALAPVNFWRSTSTLYITVTEPLAPCLNYDEDQDAWRRGKVIAKGIMHIQPKDFLSEVMTMTPTGSSLLKKVISATNFMTYFTRKSLSLFLAPLTPLQYPSQSYNGYINDYSQPDESFSIYARDGVCTKMHMWKPTHIPKGTEVKDLFMIPGASVDHQIYALPTIPYNAVNYFTRAGYRVWITVHRIGQLMIAENNWTTYNAREDIRACLDYIRQEFYKKGLNRDPPKIYTIAHCMGSVAFASGLLDGTIPADWILGVTCSQVFMNPIWNTLNFIKATAGPFPLDYMYKKLAGSWFSCSTSTDDSLVQRGLNQLLRLMPDSRSELCNSAACHRTSLVFGRCWNHRNLNEATHRQIDRFFGGVNMTLLHLLMRMGADGHVMGNGPLFERLTTRQNIAHLKGLPFLLFVGRDNAVLSPESTERTYEILCDTFGSSGAHAGGAVEYRRRVVPGYGHLDCWMGRNAWKDVYPFVREEVDRVVRGETYRFEEPEDRFTEMIKNGDLVY
ncbi:Cholesterol oxidase [Pleurostoma richardsiae]|uniref:Cholesterol oxidase n=1 Tax=Pleurostoma richardsiae TaxID=41990 RepID=A0AA38VN93_9PEZI|nr:Cholesterol oxidase [Pleurostoma richardsiae]